MKKSRVLITGGAGYIGSVLCRQLLSAGYPVRVYDRLDFGDAGILELKKRDEFELVRADLLERDKLKNALRGCEVVVHLAAIVGEPASKKFPEETIRTNETGSRILHEFCSEAGISHFIFASTCSNYGVMKDENELLNEESPLAPQSLYAKTKVEFEEYLLRKSEIPRTILRFATVYGVSPRMRFDLTVNHFCRDLYFGKTLEVFGYDLWRPYCHVSDLAASVLSILEKGNQNTDGEVYNVGKEEENYTKKKIVGLIREFLPAAAAVFVDKHNQDNRNYRVDFSKIAKECDFNARVVMREGIKEIIENLNNERFENPYKPEYSNI